MAGEVNMNSQKTETHTSHAANVTASVKVEPTGIGEGLKLNPWYFKSVPGIIKLVQLVFGMICLGCGSPALLGYARFYLFVAALCYIVTVLLCIIYILGVNTALSNLPWTILELGYTAAATILYLIASIVQIVMTSGYRLQSPFAFLRDQYIAAGVFGFIQCAAYGAGVFFLFLEWKSSRPVRTTATPNN